MGLKGDVPSHPILSEVEGPIHLEGGSIGLMFHRYNRQLPTLFL